jgi:hypothetical protein
MKIQLGGLALLMGAVSFGCSSEGGSETKDMAVRMDAAGDGSSDAFAGPGSSCANAVDLTGMTTPYSASTKGLGLGSTGAGCSMDSQGSPELYFTYNAGSTATDLIVDVVVDPQGLWDAVVSARSDCTDDTTEKFCANFGGGQHLEVLGATGPTSIIVDGTTSGPNGIDQGKFTIQVKKRTIVGMGDACDPQGVTARCGKDLLCQSGHCVTDSATIECATAQNLTAMLLSGPVTLTQTVLPFSPDYYFGSCAYDNMMADPMANYPEVVYRIDVAVPSILTASTDNMTTDYDTVIYVDQSSCGGTEVGCNDDVDTNGGNYRSNLSLEVLPGTYYMFVDTSSASLLRSDLTIEPRTFKLTVTLTVAPPDASDDH